MPATSSQIFSSSGILSESQHQRELVLGGEAANRDAVVQMQFARTIIILEAIGDIDIPLDFRQRDARADRMDGARWDEIAVARFHRFPVDPLFQGRVLRGGAELVRGHGTGEADAQSRAGSAVEDIPDFLFPTR